MANGIDYNRLTLLIAVLEKRAGVMLGNQDVYLNVVSSLKMELTVCLQTKSSSSLHLTQWLHPFLQVHIIWPVAIGEVGLTGEVRAVNMIEKRLTWWFFLIG